MRVKPLARKLQRKFNLGKNSLVMVYDGDVSGRVVHEFWNNIFKKINDEPNYPCLLVISSTGGDFDAMRDFYSKVRFYDVNLATVGVGRIWSAGITMLASGRKRFATRQTSFFLHQTPFDGKSGMNYRDAEQLLRECRFDDSTEESILAENLRISREEIHKLVENETTFDAKKALEIGLIHKII